MTDSGPPPNRVLMVSSLWPPVTIGGAESYAHDLAAHLRARGSTVGVLTLGVDGPDVVEEVRAFPYRLDRFASQGRSARALFHALDVYRPATSRAVAAAIREFHPDVVHSHSVQGLSSTALSAPSKHGVAHVHTLHDYWLLCQRASLVKRSGEACETRCRSCAAISAIRNGIIERHPPDRVIAVSEAIAREHEHVGWMRGRTTVIHNPVEGVHHPVRREPSAAGVTFGYLGQLTTAKGVPTLVRAFTRSGLAGARLLIAGDGPLREELGRARGPVELLGRVDGDAKESFFERIDVLVVPSEWKDPAPLVVNEARARAIPVIGADIGGIPELIDRASAPLLFPAGDDQALGERLTRFARRPADFAPHSREGLLDWDAHLGAVIATYGDARRPAGARPT